MDEQMTEQKTDRLSRTLCLLSV